MMQASNTGTGGTLLLEQVYGRNVPGGNVVIPCDCCGAQDELCCVNVLKWMKAPANAAALRNLIQQMAKAKAAVFVGSATGLAEV